MPVAQTAVDAALETLCERLEKCATARECAWALSDAASRLFGLDDCVSYLLNSDAQTITQVSAFGPKIKLGQMIENAITLPLGRGIVGHVAATGVAICVPDTRMDTRYIVDDEARRSELAVPIAAGHRLFGVLDSEHELADYYQPQHVDVFARLANAAAERMARLLDVTPTKAPITRTA